MRALTSRHRTVAIAITATILALAGSVLVAGPASAASNDISGTVTDAGRPVAGASVQLERYDDLGWGYEADVTTDANGHWSLTDLDDGQYATYYYLYDSDAIYSSDQGWDGSLAYDQVSTQFTVTNGVASTTTVNEAVLRNAGAISVSFYDAKTGALITGAPVVEGENGGSGSVYGNGYDEVTGSLPNLRGEADDAAFTGTVLAHGALPGTYLNVEASASSGAGVAYRTEILQQLSVTVGATTFVNAYLYPSGTTSVATLIGEAYSPSISGTAKVGSILSTNAPAVDGVSYEYQWYTAAAPIIGATAPTFVPTPKQLGQNVQVLIIGRAAGYSTSTFFSAQPTKLVQLGDPDQGTVSITGTAAYGQTVSAAVSTQFAGSKTLQWYLNGSPIGGATGTDYTIKPSDVGNALSVAVTSVVQGHSDATISSEAVLVAPGSLNAVSLLPAPDTANPGSVSIAGTAKFGKTVKAAVSTALPGTVSYQWFRNNVPVGGSDGSSYTIGQSDLSSTLSVVAKSVVQGHTDAVLISPAVAVPKDVASLKATAAKTISAKKKLKVTVTVKPGASKLAATAKVKVYYLSKKFTTVTVKSGKSAMVTLPKLKKGKHTIKIVYPGTASYGAKTVTVSVKVTR